MESSEIIIEEDESGRIYVPVQLLKSHHLKGRTIVSIKGDKIILEKNKPVICQICGKVFDSLEGITYKSKPLCGKCLNEMDEFMLL